MRKVPNIREVRKWVQDSFWNILDQDTEIQLTPAIHVKIDIDNDAIIICSYYKKEIDAFIEFENTIPFSDLNEEYVCKIASNIAYKLNATHKHGTRQEYKEVSLYPAEERGIF